MKVSDFKKPVLAGAAFFSTVCVLSVGYAAYTALSPVNTGDQLKKTDWNTMVANLADFGAKLAPVSVVSNFVGVNTPVPESRFTVTHDRTGGSVNVANFVDSTYGTNVSLFGWVPGIGFNYFHNGSTAMIYKGGGYAGEINFVPSTGIMNFKIWDKQATDKTATTFLTQPLTITASGSVGIGTTAPLAALDVNGDFIRTIPRWQGYGNDQTDNGILAGRTFSMTKKYAATGVRVAWTDNFRVLTNNTACSWEILFNGASCPNPGAIRFDKYEGNVNSNRHDPVSVFGTCFGLPAGTVTVTTKVSQKASHPGGDCSTGWDSALVSIEGEEVR